MKTLSISVQVPDNVAKRLELQAVPLEGRFLDYLDIITGTPTPGCPDFKGLTPAALAAGVTFMGCAGFSFKEIKVTLDRGGALTAQGVSARTLRELLDSFQDVEDLSVPAPPSFVLLSREVKDAVRAGRPGFAGGWVSSMALDALIARRVAPNKARDLMAAMGYVWHPALTRGRVNNPVKRDGGKKPRLYVEALGPLVSIKKPADVARAYEEAQR